MIPRLAEQRFLAAVRRLGRHKAARLSVDIWTDYGAQWGVAMEWGAGPTKRRHGIRMRAYGPWRRGKRRKSPEHMALKMVRALAAWRCRKRVMRKRRAR